MDSLSVLSDAGLAAVAQDESDQSAEAGGSEIEVWKARLSGKDKALTRERQEREQARAEAEQALARLAEIEAENAALRAHAAAWRQQAVSVKYPNVASALGEGAASLDPAQLEALEARFGALATSQATADDDGYTPRVDMNQPRRTYGATTPKRPEQMTEAELLESLRKWEGIA